MTDQINTEQEKDYLYDEAVEFVIEANKPYVSSVQRKFRIGYNRACHILEQLEQNGIVSKQEGNGVRTVLAPPKSERELEQAIQDKGLTAARVTPATINALMSNVAYTTHIVPGTTTTLATAVMGNGFTLATSESACASPQNFNAELGAKAAIDKVKIAARDKLWELEGYRLKRSLEEKHQ